MSDILLQNHMRHLHQHWTTLVTSALPFMGQSLTHVVINVINQLCYNLEKLAQCYEANSKRYVLSTAFCKLQTTWMISINDTAHRFTLE